MVPQKTRWKQRLQAALGLGVSAGLLWWTLAQVPVPQLREAFQQVEPGAFLLALLVFVWAFPARARAWQVLLGPGVPFRPVFAALMVGFLVTNVLPLRLGEAARMMALRQALGVPWPALVTSVLLDRLSDAGLLLGIVLFLSPWVWPQGELPHLWAFGLPLLAVLGLGVWAWPHLVEGLARGARRLQTHPHRWQKRLGQGLGNLARGLQPMASRGVLVRFLGWKVLTWLPVFLSQDLLLRQWFPHGAWWWAPWLTAVTTLATVLPSAPGHLGTMEAGALAALQPLSQDRAANLALALTQHALYYVVTTGLGLVALGWLGLSLTRLWQMATTAVQRPQSLPGEDRP